MSQRKLYRSQADRKIAGVCGGLGEHFHMDPIIWRVIFIALFFSALSGVLLYIIMWIAVPEQISIEERRNFKQQNKNY
jgi:phage shock protein C